MPVWSRDHPHNVGGDACPGRAMLRESGQVFHSYLEVIAWTCLLTWSLRQCGVRFENSACCSRRLALAGFSIWKGCGLLLRNRQSSSWQCYVESIEAGKCVIERPDPKSLEVPCLEPLAGRRHTPQLPFVVSSPRGRSPARLPIHLTAAHRVARCATGKNRGRSFNHASGNRGGSHLRT